jgi:hypothetical protein
VAYAKHVAAEAEDVEKQQDEENMEAEASVSEAELYSSSRSATGYLGVYRDGRRFIAQCRGRRLGGFASAVEAAVAYRNARVLGDDARDERDAAEEAEEMEETRETMCERAEELVILTLSTRSNTGYKGVTRRENGKFYAQVKDRTRHVNMCLGLFDSVVEAATAVARYEGAANAAGKECATSDDRRLIACVPDAREEPQECAEPGSGTSRGGGYVQEAATDEAVLIAREAALVTREAALMARLAALPLEAQLTAREAALDACEAAVDCQRPLNEL